VSRDLTNPRAKRAVSIAGRGVPSLRQKRLPGRFSAPQEGQKTGRPTAGDAGAGVGGPDGGGSAGGVAPAASARAAAAIEDSRLPSVLHDDM
jgi:hypothetical protein